MELGVFETPGREWDDFASRHTDLIFYQSLWSEVLKKGLGGQPLYFFLREGGQILAGLPGVLLDFKVFRVYYASIPYGNVFGQLPYFGVFLELLEGEFKRRKIHQVRITESPFFPSWQPRGFKSITATGTLLDLRRFQEDRLRENYRSDVRRAVRKAEKEGLSIKRLTSGDAPRIFHRLYLSSMERNLATAKYPLRWFQALCDLLGPLKKADIFFAMKGDQYAAGVVVAFSSTSLHYLHNGSENAYLEHRPNDLIVDSLVQEGIREGKTVLDFMGSDVDDLSLIRFKEKWGGQSNDLHTYVKDYDPLRCKIWEVGRELGNTGLGRRLVRTIRN